MSDITNERISLYMQSLLTIKKKMLSIFFSVSTFYSVHAYSQTKEKRARTIERSQGRDEEQRSSFQSEIRLIDEAFTAAWSKNLRTNTISEPSYTDPVFLSCCCLVKQLSVCVIRGEFVLFTHTKKKLAYPQMVICNVSQTFKLDCRENV